MLRKKALKPLGLQGCIIHFSAMMPLSPLSNNYTNDSSIFGDNRVSDHARNVGEVYCWSASHTVKLLKEIATQNDTRNLAACQGVTSPS